MRNSFSESMIEAAKNPSLVLLTGDLGFRLFEPLRETMGERFINAGVAEQNMVVVAAGLAASGLRPVVYSITPFLYARPFEQIRNNVTLHKLPVLLVGNGGGYGYGAMGPTHHGLEDYGAMLCLPMTFYVPPFAADVQPIVKKAFDEAAPAYIRLGVNELAAGLTPPPYSPWRKLIDGPGPTIIVVGALVSGIWKKLLESDGPKPKLWVLSELPVEDCPEEVLNDIGESGSLILIEEHRRHGGFGEMLSLCLLRKGILPKRLTHLFAQGYPSKLFGSQAYHRAESGLDPQSVADLLSRES